MSLRTLLLLLIGWGTTAYAQPAVTKVEPPNWWTGHSVNPVRLLIRGTHLSGASVTGLGAANVRVNANGTYLFAEITIPPQPGNYPLTIKTAQGTTNADFRVDKPLSHTGQFQGFSPDDVIYLIMPDRFANGDKSNDDPAGSNGLLALDKPRYYHGGDFKGIIDHLPYLKNLGITALWLTPVYDNVNHLNQVEKYDGQPITDYHGYGAVDYYGVEEHFGNAAQLRELVESAHHLGMKVIQDQVANHTGPYHPWVDNPPLPTWYHGTRQNHINESWQTWSLPDHNSNYSIRQTVLDGWFGGFLPDLNQDEPEVARYEIQNTLWWIGQFGFDGIRQDTLPYVPREFWSQWSAAIRREYPDVKVVGEVLDGDPVLTSYFQGVVDTVFDFPTYFKLRETFAMGKSVTEVAASLAHDRLYSKPEMLVTLLGLHDLPRFMNEKGASVDGLKLAFTFLLTSRGIPMIYYGDEIGMEGGPDPDNRRDFPINSFNAENSLRDYVSKLIHLHGELEALRRGTQTNLFIGEQTWMYARDREQQRVVVAINNGKEAATLDLPAGVFQAQLKTATIAGQKIKLPPRSAEILVSNSH